MVSLATNRGLLVAFASRNSLKIEYSAFNNMAFSVAWDAYQTNICAGLSSLQQRGRFVDMTIAADGHYVKAHQMVLSLVSPYIGDLISSADCPHPVIFLNQVSYQTLQSILQYAYTGEVLIARDKISEFLEACKALHIRGVEDLSHSGMDNIEQETESMGIDVPTSASSRKTEDLKPSFRHERSDNDDTMDSFDQDDQPFHGGGTASPTENKSELYSATKTISDNLQYTVSVKGSLQLVCNRYLYFLMSSRKSGERMWRCMTYKKRKGSVSCRAFLVTKDNKITKRVGAHNHPFHDSQILKRLNRGNMFSALNEVETHLEKATGNAAQDSDDNETSVVIIQDKNIVNSSMKKLT